MGLVSDPWALRCSLFPAGPRVSPWCLPFCLACRLTCSGQAVTHKSWMDEPWRAWLAGMDWAAWQDLLARAWAEALLESQVIACTCSNPPTSFRRLLSPAAPVTSPLSNHLVTPNARCLCAQVLGTHFVTGTYFMPGSGLQK